MSTSHGLPNANNLYRTLFKAVTWPLSFHDDPLAGWNLAQVLGTPCGNATHDLMGKLYSHIDSHIWSSHQFLFQKGADFKFLSMDASRLIESLPKSAFARIEVSC